MKKLLGITALLAMLGMVLVGCASKEAPETAATGDVAAPAAPTAPTEAVELIYGVDYILEPVFGTDYFEINDTSVKFLAKAQNNNHAVLVRFLDPAAVLFKGCTLSIEYEMGEYDASKACQICTQPSDEKNADYGAQRYPILYNNFEDNSFVLTVELDQLLKSTVKKNCVGFRICNNLGSYERYTWQDNWDFTITKVTLNPAN